MRQNKKITKWIMPILATICLTLSVPAAKASGCQPDGPTGGPFHIDRCDEFEANGILARKYQNLLDVAVIAGTLGTALWQGTDSETGRVSWKTLDSITLTALVTQSMKMTFQRVRPRDAQTPDEWRKGRKNQSFPSGETALMAAFATPIIATYHREHPEIWALATLPVYMGVARMASKAHWLSDVLVGGAIGVTVGLYASQKETPLILAPTRDGAFIGYRQSF